MEKIKFSEDDVRLQLEVSNELVRLGIPAHLNGFAFLREAIIMSMCDPSYIKRLTRGLYPDIATKVGSTAVRVERSMRHAIEIAFIRGDTKVIEDYFAYSIDSSKGKACNGEFIALLSERLSMKIQLNGFTS